MKSSTTTVQLGFAVGSGDPVAIPIGHMAVVGQTQAAGKTTALEALACRLPYDYRILAFRTKRGESGFAGLRATDARGRVDTYTLHPFFRERADWEFVSSILEATMRERMKFERGWIMRASKGAKTLAEVHSNVKRLMAGAKGLSADVYYQLDTYLDKVVPQVQSLGSPTALVLSPHLNVMDLSTFSLEMQSLIIASCLDSIYQTNHNTIVVIPEAWEFLPRQRRSPVTVAAEAFVRKGAALRNYLWIDSQDLSGVHTPILKQVSVWLLGVQREINEAKRTIAHVHTQQKPKVDAVAALGLGQFIACFGDRAVKTYVQPAWMDDETAQRTARGELRPVAGGRSARVIHAPEPYVPGQQFQLGETIVTNEEADRLREENRRLQVEILALKAKVAAMDDGTIMGETTGQLTGPADPQRRSGSTPLHGRPLDDNGKIEFYPATPRADDEPAAPGSHPPESRDDLYAWILHRLIQDQTVTRLVAQIIVSQPEILITTAVRKIDFDGGSPRGRLAKMIADGIMNDPIKPGVIIAEFKRTGGQIHPSNMSKLLDEFVGQGFVTREEGSTYQKAAGLKISQKSIATAE